MSFERLVGTLRVPLIALLTALLNLGGRVLRAVLRGSAPAAPSRNAGFALFALHRAPSGAGGLPPGACRALNRWPHIDEHAKTAAQRPLTVDFDAPGRPPGPDLVWSVRTRRSLPPPGSPGVRGIVDAAAC